MTEKIMCTAANTTQHSSISYLHYDQLINTQNADCYYLEHSFKLGMEMKWLCMIMCLYVIPLVFNVISVCVIAEASVGLFHLMKMKISMIRSRMLPSCTLLTPGRKSPMKVLTNQTCSKWPRGSIVSDMSFQNPNDSNSKFLSVKCL